MEDGEFSETLDRLLALALERGAIKYGDFTLTSGKKSSYYFDGRLLSLDPEGAYLISQAKIPLLEQSGARLLVVLPWVPIQGLPLWRWLAILKVGLSLHL